jgi:hypothetical protein
MRFGLFGLASCLALLAMEAFAAQPPIAVNGSKISRTYDCERGLAIVNGSRNTVKFLNCESVNVTGSHNQIDAGRATAITVEGDGNTVSWSGVTPRIVDLGRNNTVRAARGSSDDRKSPTSDEDTGRGTKTAPGAKAATMSMRSDGKMTVARVVKVFVSEDAQTVEHDCKGADAEISGNGNTVRLADCRVVSVLGDRNTVRTDGVETLNLAGAANTVSWNAARKPLISDLGDGNKIMKR